MKKCLVSTQIKSNHLMTTFIIVLKKQILSVFCNMLLTNVYNVGNIVLTTLYKSCIRPYLDYASVIYSPYYSQITHIIKNLQIN